MEFTVLQWNTWLDESIGNIIAELKRIDADILCLQELTVAADGSENRPEMVQQALGLEMCFSPAHTSSENGRVLTMGNAVLSRFPFEASRAAVMRESGKKGGHLERGRSYAEATLRTPAGVITAGSTHLSYLPGFADTPDKMDEIERLIAALGPSPRRRLVTGDFNVTPQSRAIARMREQMVDAGPPESEKTWTTKPYQSKEFSADTVDWRLDYIFVSQDVEVISSEIVQPEDSDHLPVLGIIGLH